MSRIQWIVSVLIAYHLAAVSCHLLPNPAGLNEVNEIREGDSHRGILTRTLTPIVDRGAWTVSRVEPMLFAATAPLRSFTQPYISAGLRQDWAMFSDPDLKNQYTEAGLSRCRGRRGPPAGCAATDFSSR